MHLQRCVLGYAGHLCAYLKCFCFQRQFLQAGKHVLVEYPMTLSFTAAQELWELAAQKGDVFSDAGAQTCATFLPLGF